MRMIISIQLLKH